LRHAARLGEPLTARIGADRRSGIFETIDETGALILQTPEGRVAIPAGDVYF
jgi:BirA family biotin operon repressor/biotin-[acetyl-CoA-carboxylase] ligase